jgi:copper chaperone
MITFQVDDMTCGHCVSMITKAVRHADKKATVNVDMSSHRVDIEPTEATAQQLAEAIKDAGYTPVAVAAGAESNPAPTSRSGCCCG